jgi:hypothetical protein
MVPDGLDLSVQEDKVNDSLNYPQVVAKRIAEAFQLVEQNQQGADEKNHIIKM